MDLAKRLGIITKAANLLNVASDSTHVKLEPSGGWECNVVAIDGEVVDVFDEDEREYTTGHSSPEQAVAETEKVMIRKLIAEKARIELNLHSVSSVLETLEKNERGDE